MAYKPARRTAGAVRRAQLKARIAAMPKCPVCGGFAIPSTRPPEPGELKTFICADHGAFLSDYDKG